MSFSPEPDFDMPRLSNTLIPYEDGVGGFEILMDKAVVKILHKHILQDNTMLNPCLLQNI
jgi:hypothetical protein